MEFYRRGRGTREGGKKWFEELRHLSVPQGDSKDTIRTQKLEEEGTSKTKRCRGVRRSPKWEGFGMLELGLLEIRTKEKKEGCRKVKGKRKTQLKRQRPPGGVYLRGTSKKTNERP